MIRSGVFSSGSLDTQKAIVAELLNNIKSKSYLPLLTYKFLTEGVDSVSSLPYELCINNIAIYLYLEIIF